MIHRADASHGLLHRWHQWTFNALYGRSLLYNTCWEDPALDRVAMRLQSDSEVLVITSAGCNALEYLLDEPRLVHAVDANPRQTALLELKMAAIAELDWLDFFRLFGIGVHRDMARLYRERLRRRLSPAARQFWDGRRHWFSGRGWRKSFYYYGLSGLVARLMTTFIEARPGLARGLRRLLDAETLDEQQAIYDHEVAERLFPASLRWILDRQFTMHLLGVPYEQGQSVAAEHDGGIAGFIQDAIAYVCRQLPMRDNYFWRVYLTGGYTPRCCPAYLRPENFTALKDLLPRLRPATCTITDYLTEGRAAPSHLVLLDHMDWMGSAFPQALVEEWQAIFARSRADARILFRSAASDPRFLDHCRVDELSLREHLDFDLALADELHRLDRVHTYASFHIADRRAAAEPA